MLKLGDSISPFPKPTDDNVLTTSGVYGLARHPMYGGLILTCVGLSVLSGSFPRLFFTAILAATLNFKAPPSTRTSWNVGQQELGTPRFCSTSDGSRC